MAERLVIKRFLLPVGRLGRRYVTGLSKYLSGADQLLMKEILTNLDI